MAEAYYEPTPATDGASMNPVPGAVFQVYEISDTTFSTPLSLRVGAGNPTTTVAASETLATLPGVYVTSPNYEHHWVSGSFVWRRDSIDGAKKSIEDAKAAASNAASASENSRAEAAASAQAARDAAALVDAPADQIMADIAANTGSAFAGQLRNTVTEQLADVPLGGLTPNTMILFGTSLEFQNGSGADVLDISDAATDAPLSGRGWAHWANAYLGNQMTIVRNAGIGGNTYAQMLARMDADVLAHESEWVWMGGPTNDTSSGRSAASVIADATAILDKLAGRKVLILTGPPNGGHEAGSETAALFEVNKWIRSLPATRANVVVADAWRVLSNGSTVAPATGLANDSVHYSMLGAARVGRVAADAVRPWIAAKPHRTTSPVDPACIIANPSLTGGTGWSTLGTGVSAVYASDEDTMTTKAVLTYSGVTSTGNLGIQAQENVSTGRWASGNVVRVSARIRWTDAVALSVASNFGPVLMLTFRAADNTTKEYFWGYVASSFNLVPNGIPKSGDVVVTTAKYTIPATLVSGSPVDRLEVRVGFRGIASGVVTVSDVAPVKV